MRLCEGCGGESTKKSTACCWGYHLSLFFASGEVDSSELGKAPFGGDGVLHLALGHLALSTWEALVTFLEPNPCTQDVSGRHKAHPLTPREIIQHSPKYCRLKVGTFPFR